jgi:hypothetical protein
MYIDHIMNTLRSTDVDTGYGYYMLQTLQHVNYWKSRIYNREMLVYKYIKKIFLSRLIILDFTLKDK